MALEIHERLRAPYWIASTQLDLCELLRDRGDPGDAARARPLLDAAAATAAAHGYLGVQARASSLVV